MTKSVGYSSCKGCNTPIKCSGLKACQGNSDVKKVKGK